jgi:hypothetical protein
MGGDDGAGGLTAPDGVLNAGDVVAGLLRWNLKDDHSPFGDTAITIFAAEILTDTSAGLSIGGKSTRHFDLGAVTSSIYTLAHEIPAQAALHSISATTIAATFSNPGGADLTAEPWATATGAGIGLDNTASWWLDLTLGIQDGGFFEVDLIDFNASGSIEIAEFFAAGLSEGDQVGLEATAFNAIINNVGTLLPVTATRIDFTTSTADVALPSTQLLFPSTGELDDGYVFANQATARINPVPEPTSLFIWAAIVGIAIGCGVWRRR